MMKPFSYFFLMLNITIFYSCAVKKVVKNDEVQVVKTTKDPNTEKEKAEVVVFKDITPESKPPIQASEPTKPIDSGTKHANDTKIDERKPQIDKALNQEFNIAMIIPFSDQTNLRFLQFYSGAKIASKELETEGARLNITVIDANDIDYLSKINSAVDLIIAPSDEKQIKSLAEYGKSNKTPVLSSFFSLSSIVENPYYIQTRPSLKAHYTSMLSDIHTSYNENDVVIIGRKEKNEASWFEPFQSEGRKIKGMFEGNPYAEHLLNEANITFGSALTQGKKVFIFPNFSFKDEDFLAAALSKLKMEKGNKKIIVYAMSVVKDSEKIGKELFESLNIKIPTSKFIDKESDETKTFTNDYFMTYSDLPSSDAFEGADNMLFIGRALSRYGKLFPENLYKLNEDYLQTSFDMRSVNKNSLSLPDYYENQHIKMLTFDGTKFRP